MADFANGTFDTDISSWFAGKKPSEITGLKVWFDISQETGFINGDDMGQITDFSGNGYHVTQGTASQKGHYTTSAVNGLPVVRTTGGQNMFYYNSSFSEILGNSKWFSLQVFMKSTTSYENYVVFKFGKWASPAGSVNLGTQYGGTTYEFQNLIVGTGYAWSGWHSFNIGDYVIGGYGYDQAKKWGYGCGAIHSTNFTIQNNAGSVLALFTSKDTAFQYGHVGDYAEGFLFNDFLTDQQKADLHSYLAMKYQIAITEQGINCTRDTGTKYAGAASLKVVAISQGDVYEYITPTSTKYQTLVGYAYTDGSEVTSADVELFADNQTATTAFSSVGGGWYSMTAVVTGGSTPIKFGAQVKAGKTVYLDSFSLTDGAGSPSASLSPSSSLSPSASVSPSASESKSISPSTSISPSASASKSISPSASQSQSLSPSASESKSISPSASESKSISPSESESASLSPSASESASESPSSSISPSSSASASPAEATYTKGNYAVLPADNTDLENIYTAQEVLDVEFDDEVYVEQVGTLQYMIHQFKNSVGTRDRWTVFWNGKSSLAPSSSKVVLQIYDINGAIWEDLQENNIADADTDFNLTGTITADADHYKDGSNVITCRVYQLAI